jgi:tetratricopeptide (TPR) repeat protein
MSECLRDLSVEHLNEALKLMRGGKHKEASKDLLYVQAIKGYLMQILGAYEEASKILFLNLKTTEELFSKDPDNELYHSIFQMNLDSIFTLGRLFNNKGLFLQAKNCYELHISTFQNLLKTDPKNVAYQSDVAMTLNNLGNLLRNMGRIEEAKQRYEKGFRCKNNFAAFLGYNYCFLYHY